VIDAWVDHRRDPAAWAAALGISRAAVELYLACDVIDLHVDSFLWTRILGYDLRRRHGPGPLGGRLLSQVDLPRIREAAIAGATWVITTNPFRPAASRARAFRRNLDRLRAILASGPEDVALVRDLAGYRAARAGGLHAAFVGVQGGNAVPPGDVRAAFGGDVLRVTLVHLLRSRLGMTSAPSPVGRADDGLTAEGRAYVEALVDAGVFLDLAHIGRAGFVEALDVHPRDRPVLVTHTGVAGVHPHWRNLDDAQLRAIAATGGVVGVMYQADFLGDPALRGRAASIVDHLEHAIRLGGEGLAALGSDWDGMIVPPRDLPTCLELPRLVQIMLDRGWAEDRVRRVLGGNFLRALGALRPS
jgi:membrane dipeptidase